VTAGLALYAVTGLLLVAFGARLGRTGFLLGALPPAASVVWTAWRLPYVVGGETLVSTTTWVPGLDLALDLRLDGLTATMTLVVTSIGALTLLYAWSYFSACTPDRGRLAGLLVLFAGAMVGLVQADHLLALYAFWELTTVTSYLLIGNDHTNPRARAAALHALAATGTGGLALLGGVVVLGQAYGTFRISELVTARAPGGAAVTVAVLLLLMAAFTKSAQYPFHAWLPGAMVAPTPISAYLHSAAMVKAGVYLVAIAAPLFATTTGVWRPVVLAVGVVTLIAGGLRALRQHDLKLLLAYGTVSQLGLLIVLFGAGTRATTVAGVVLLVAHALFKAALFMVVGILDTVAGTRDLREIPALGRGWALTRAVAAISAASMAGVPPAAGFVAKESAYAALLDAPFSGHVVVLVATVAGSMLTAAYAWRFFRGAFGPRAVDLPDRRDAQKPALSFTVAPAVLAAATLVFGVVPGMGEDLLSAAVPAFGFPAEAVDLALWHGFNAALVLSAVTLAGAAALAAADRVVQPVLASRTALPTGQMVHLSLLRLLQRVSTRVTSVTQSGSLPVYSAIILATAALLPLAALGTAWDWPDWPAAGRLSDLPPVALLLIASVGAATVRRRFSAAVFLGVTGYAMTALFFASGAPDLALTQAVVETLSTVLFVLVLRWLPPGFEPQSFRRRQVSRAVVATMVGAAVFVFAIVTSGTTPSTVSEELIARAVPDGHGRNVVNVILVDFRALDTLGEITVLAAAAIGAVALARVGVRAAAERGELPSRTGAADVSRIVFVDVPVRFVFYAVLLMSLWLLFAGHNQPGGGFVGGLLAGCAITLRYVAAGMAAVRGSSRFRPWTVLGAGLLLTGATAGAPMLNGSALLDVAYGAVPVPLVGSVTLTSALAFDAGVYLTVVGIVMMAFEAFGEEFPLRAR
jgi:multicomponent Na+:H+ antiporter subunit A